MHLGCRPIRLFRRGLCCLTMLPWLAVSVAKTPTAAESAAPPQAIMPYESEVGFEAANLLDGKVLPLLTARGIQPAALCSDEVFLRRVYLDVIGTLPDPAEVHEFLRDSDPRKRAALIEALLEREEYADYWSLKWCDLLRVKAEFPINLWPNAAQAYHRWIREALRENMPLDRFARALLTSSGSNFRNPPVNFYRAVQGKDASSLTAAVALTFLGSRIESWPAERRAGMEVFFSKVAYKGTHEWKEEIVHCDPAPRGALKAVFPDGKPVEIAPDADPRVVFADWLLDPKNPAFARNLANRAWAWLMGRGIIHEPDDIRPDNPPSNHLLLDYLERELVKSGFDMKHLLRVILNSRTYQQSSIPRDARPEAEALFAFYPPRRLEAEVLIDALCGIGETGESYSSAIPEPFSFIPPAQRTIALADGSITSAFLEQFGRPARDTGLESERNNHPTDEQRLYLLNSNDVRRKIERSPRIERLVNATGRDQARLIRSLYLMILSREPTRQEAAAAADYFRSSKLRPRQAATDLAWALINSKEFLYRH